MQCSLLSLFEGKAVLSSRRHPILVESWMCQANLGELLLPSRISRCSQLSWTRRIWFNLWKRRRCVKHNNARTVHFFRWAALPNVTNKLKPRSNKIIQNNLCFHIKMLNYQLFIHHEVDWNPVNNNGSDGNRAVLGLWPTVGQKIKWSKSYTSFSVIRATSPVGAVSLTPSTWIGRLQLLTVEGKQKIKTRSIETMYFSARPVIVFAKKQKQIQNKTMCFSAR